MYFKKPNNNCNKIISKIIIKYFGVIKNVSTFVKPMKVTQKLSKMKTKKVIQRSLPLDVEYSVVSVSYISLEDGGGCACDNCGKLITNMATVKSSKGQYIIGLDCLDTVILNNDLLKGENYLKYLYSDKPAIDKAKSLRAKILKAVKKDSTFRAELVELKDSFGFRYTIEKTQTRKYNEVTKKLDTVAPFLQKEPQGYDYRFDLAYKELTLSYVKNIPEVLLK